MWNKKQNKKNQGQGFQTGSRARMNKPACAGKIMRTWNPPQKPQQHKKTD